VIALPLSAGPVVFTFDDIDTGGSIVAMPAGYAGIDWPTNFGVYGWNESPYNPHSAPNKVLVNRGDEPNPTYLFSFITPGVTIFVGAWFSGWTEVSFDLYRQGVLVHSSVTLATSGTPAFLASGYNGVVDSVTINGQGGLYVFDDLTLDRAGVPEPASLALFALGGALLAFMRGRARAKLRKD
jgi:hypothetical protein